MQTFIRVTIAAAMLASTGAAQAQAVQLHKPVPYAQENDVSDAIKKECHLGEKLADFVKAKSSVPVELTSQAPNRASGRVLQMEISDAVSMGNAFMGHQKFAKVKGTLFENGKKVASFKARRNSMGGAFGGFKGSCSVLGRTVAAIGADVGKWLAKPVDGAALGD
ncbi:MAG: hypothetical protein WBP11_01940 [Dokdonella sp.]